MITIAAEANAFRFRSLIVPQIPLLGNRCRVRASITQRIRRPNGRGTRCPAYLPHAWIASPSILVAIVFGE